MHTWLRECTPVRGREGQDGISSLDVSADMVKDVDPEHWIKESAELAKTYAYALPVSRGTNATPLSRDHETNAGNVAPSQAALAGARLANIINAARQ
ncbi:MULTISPECIES: S1/P1 nuclease [unclassified Sinorhizobium]|uniref:S1/P1 nuclease n=1 Tax=unclassified Sinorhizobium TaxID=2613772 RepID=UPI0035234A4D